MIANTSLGSPLFAAGAGRFLPLLYLAAALIVGAVGIVVMFKLAERHHRKMLEKQNAGHTQIVVHSAKVVDR
jgi:Flp pilus assembly protein TadB